MEQFIRQNILISEEMTIKLNNKTVMIFGLGGVGSFVVESLARSGIGHFILIDNDTISISNINRQLFALHSTIGQKKVDVAKNRILDINPQARVDTFDRFILKDNLQDLPFSECDYIIDCVDNVTAKISIISQAKINKIPIISSMGTGNKLDPSKFKIVDISKTSICPLARVMRYELRKRNIENVDVLFSTEEIIKSRTMGDNGKLVPGSISFVPSSAGLLIARFVIFKLIK